MRTKLRITLVFLLIAALFGLTLRLMHASTLFYNYKHLLHTHSHIALLGWLYNAALIVLQYFIFKNNDKVFNRIFCLSQISFVGMLFSFPFEGYGLFSITFSTFYLFCSYYLVYELFKQSKTLKSTYVARFIQWGGIYLVISSIGPFALGATMAFGLKETIWYKLSIYWFIHFLYNGFFVFIVFAYLLHRYENLKNQGRIFQLMNFSVIPLYGLSVLWTHPAFPFYLLAFMGALLQLLAFYYLFKGYRSLPFSNKSLSNKLFTIAVFAYGLKIIFQLAASFDSVQLFLNSTVATSIIGYLHLVMLGFFTLFFLSIFIQHELLKVTRILKIGLLLLLLGIVLSESLLFGQSISNYFFKTSIENYYGLLFWASALMPLGIVFIALQAVRKKEYQLEEKNRNPVVWQLSVLHLADKTLISGVLLNRIPFSFDKKIGKFQHALQVFKSYFVGVYSDKKISITANQKTINTTTDEYGSFSVVADFHVTDKVLVRAVGYDKPLNILQSYPVVFRNTKSRFDVISDIDDTILVSYTANMIKRIGILSFVTPEKRKTVQFTQKLLGLLSEFPANVFYVSKSESNLFGILTSFIIKHKLPKGILLLTPYLSINRLIKEKKDKFFKLDHIQFIIENSSDKKFILFGDDTQKDMEVYQIIAQNYPKKIARIYIRQTKMHVNQRKLRLFKKLKETFPNAVYFNINTNIDRELKNFKNLLLTEIDVK